MSIKQTQMEELLVQALETELGGVQVYTAAIECAVNEDLKQEWTKYLDQTKHHVEVVRRLIETLGFNPDQITPGRRVVKHNGDSLVAAVRMGRQSAPADGAELVACECVVLAETKDHANWELLSKLAEAATGPAKEALQAACDEVEDEEDEHVYHSKGWCRELWIQWLGMPAVLPPPEEQRDVKTAIGAARAEQTRDEML